MKINNYNHNSKRLLILHNPLQMILIYMSSLRIKNFINKLKYYKNLKKNK